MYDSAESLDGIEGGPCFMLVQNYSAEETKKNNSETLLEMAKNQKDLFHKFFTVNTGEGPTKFIRTQTGNEFFAQKPAFELTKMGKDRCSHAYCDRCGAGLYDKD